MVDNIKADSDQRSLWRRFSNVAIDLSPKVLLGKVWRRSSNCYRHWFCQQNCIFRHDGPFVTKYQVGCEFAHYDSFEMIPEQVKKEICGAGDPARLEMDKLELSENAVLWIASRNGKVASIVFTRKGLHFRRWFLPLQPDDVVVFRLHTHPEFRGRGIAPALIQHAVKTVLDKPGHAYMDCRTYNKPSIRCIQKAGFKCVATKKTIKREWALYD